MSARALIKPPVEALAALGRRRQLAILRLTGVTRIQVLRMVRLEQRCWSGWPWSSEVRSPQRRSYPW